MVRVICATTNVDKFGIGQRVCNTFDIELEQVVIDIDEIQGEDPEVIIRDKAAKAYAALGKPVVVSDDSWSIPALKGFPGPYMKSINHWFTPEDFLRLMRDSKDRQIVLHQYLAYHDGIETAVFSHDIPGTLLEEARGKYGPSIMKVVALGSDNGLSIAEVYDQQKAHELGRLTGKNDAWHSFAAWLKEKQQ